MKLTLKLPPPEYTHKSCLCDQMNTLHPAVGYEATDKLKYEGVCKKCGIGIITYFTGVELDITGITEEAK